MIVRVPQVPQRRGDGGTRDDSLGCTYRTLPRMIRLLLFAVLLLFDVQSDIQRRRRMRQGPHRDSFHARHRDRADGVERDPA